MSKTDAAALRERVAELEAEVEALRQGGADAHSRDRNRKIRRLYVDDPEQLSLTNLDLALQIIDAMPVQVFIKDAQHEFEPDGSKKGRRYTFMNRKALELTGWKAEDVRNYVDKDAMSDPLEYTRMDEVETKTIEAKEVHFEDLRWTSPDGREWRINDIIQLPIARREEGVEVGEIIGFCALAQDIEFQHRVSASRPLMRIMAHEMGNLSDIVLGLLEQAQKDPTQVDVHLERAGGWVKGAHTIARAMLQSYGGGASSAFGNSSQGIRKELEYIFEPLPVSLQFSIDPQIEEVAYISPEGATGILVELLRNAIKHTSSEGYVDGMAMVEITARPDVLEHTGAPCTRWTVTNRCSNVRGQLELGDGPSSSIDDHMGGRAIMDILGHALLIKSNELTEETFRRFILFEPAEDEGLVRVSFRAPHIQQEAAND